MSRSTILLAALVALTGCFKEEPIVVASVALKVMPLTGGAKYVAVDTTGRVILGTMSAGPQPSVSEDSARMGKDEAMALMHETRALGDTLLRRAPINFNEPSGSTELAVLFSDASQARIIWQLGHEHRDARVNALAAKLAARMPQ